MTSMVANAPPINGVFHGFSSQDASVYGVVKAKHFRPPSRPMVAPLCTAARHTVHPISYLLGKSLSLQVCRVFSVTAKQVSCCQMSISHARGNRDESSNQGSIVKVLETKVTTFSGGAVEAFKVFPWLKTLSQFIQRFLDLTCIVSKWLVIPFLVLSSLSESIYTLKANKDLFIPIGILSGILIARITGKSALEAVKETQQDIKSPWPLVLMIVLFTALKVFGPYYPSWAAASLPHVATGGLVQTILLYREWQQKPV